MVAAGVPEQWSDQELRELAEETCALAAEADTAFEFGVMVSRIDGDDYDKAEMRGGVGAYTCLEEFDRLYPNSGSE